MGTDKKILTDKQKKFCEEYVIDYNARQAAIRAGYSPRSAEVNGVRLLRYAQVKDYLGKLKAEQTKRCEVNADWVLNEIKSIAGADISQAYDESGSIKHPKDMPEEVRKALSGFETVHGKRGTSRKARFNDKLKALELLGKYLKMFTDRTELDVSETLSDILQKSWDSEKDESHS